MSLKLYQIICHVTNVTLNTFCRQTFIRRLFRQSEYSQNLRGKPLRNRKILPYELLRIR